MDQEPAAADAQTLSLAALGERCGRRGRLRRVAISGVFAFTRDLRVEDHAGLAAAARMGPVVPVLVIDPAGADRLRRSPRRAAHYCAAVASLDAELRARGSALIVRRGAPGPVLRGLARAIGAPGVAWTHGYDPPALRADRDLQSFLEEAGLRAAPIHDAPAVSPEDEATVNTRGDGYRAFAPYNARWRTIAMPERIAVPAFTSAGLAGEPLPQPAEFGAPAGVHVAASPAAAAAVLRRFLDYAGLGYSVGRNVPAVDGTAHLSADLAIGTIAARTVVRATVERLRDPFLLSEETLSLRLFLRALALRDFFLHLAWHRPAAGDAPLQPKMQNFAFARTHPHIAAWRSGRTGYPLVDAGIRELHATGWMHPRVRAVAASFLCFDLGVDWRVGRDEWDRWLTEDAPVLATGNWQWIAGVGADVTAYPRIYNPRTAARRFDPAARYIRRWIPELAVAPDDAILDSPSRHADPQLALDLFGATAYPSPVVDHGTAARAFLERYTREVGTGGAQPA